MKYALVIGALLLVPTVRGQTVEFDIPTELKLDESRISVTFNDGVTKVVAAKLLTNFGLTILEARFSDVTVWAQADAKLSEYELASIRSFPAVLNVRVTELDELFGPDEALRKHIMSIRSPEWKPTSLARYQVMVRFESSTSIELATTILGHNDYLRIRQINKVPNDLVVRIDPDDSSMTEYLEQLDEIDYVAYLLATEK